MARPAWHHQEFAGPGQCCADCGSPYHKYRHEHDRSDCLCTTIPAGAPPENLHPFRQCDGTVDHDKQWRVVPVDPTWRSSRRPR